MPSSMGSFGFAMSILAMELCASHSVAKRFQATAVMSMWLVTIANMASEHSEIDIRRRSQNAPASQGQPCASRHLAAALKRRLETVTLLVQSVQAPSLCCKR